MDAIEKAKSKLRDVLVKNGHLPYTEEDRENFPHIEAMIEYLTYSGTDRESILYRSSHLIQMLAEIQQATTSIDNPW